MHRHHRDLIGSILIIRHIHGTQQGHVFQEVAQCNQRQFAVLYRFHILGTPLRQQFFPVLVLPILDKTLHAVQQFLNIRRTGLTFNGIVILERSIKSGLLGKHVRYSERIFFRQCSIGHGHHILERHDSAGSSGLYAGRLQNCRFTSIEKR